MQGIDGQTEITGFYIIIVIIIIAFYYLVLKILLNILTQIDINTQYIRKDTNDII